jgi:chromosome segregation ATPase
MPESEALRMKIEELEDTLYELKEEVSVNKIVQLDQQNENLHLQIARFQQEIQQLNHKIKSYTQFLTLF